MAGMSWKKTIIKLVNLGCAILALIAPCYSERYCVQSVRTCLMFTDRSDKLDQVAGRDLKKGAAKLNILARGLEARVGGPARFVPETAQSSGQFSQTRDVADREAPRQINGPSLRRLS
jgi:hypothetical protein